MGGGTGGGVMRKDFDGGEWARGHRHEFRELIEKARRKREEREEVAEGERVVKRAEGGLDAATPGRQRGEEQLPVVERGIVDGVEPDMRPGSSDSIVDIRGGDGHGEGDGDGGTAPPVEHLTNGSHPLTTASRFLPSPVSSVKVVEQRPIDDDPIVESDVGELSIR